MGFAAGSMRLEPKPAAAISAAGFALLLIFGAAWPGPGLWLLAAALGCIAAAGVTWWLGAASAERTRPVAQRVAQTPFSASPRRPRGFGVELPGEVGAPWRSAAIGRSLPRRVHVAAVVGACGLLGLVIFVVGAVGGDVEADPATPTSAVSPEVIDLSREGGTTALTATVRPPTTEPRASSPTAASAAPTAPDRPIVVAAPKPATPVELQPRDTSVAAPVLTVKHTVVEGDTLYEIALTYGSTVDAILTLNGLSNADVIHAGEVLLIPQPDPDDVE